MFRTWRSLNHSEIFEIVLIFFSFFGKWSWNYYFYGSCYCGISAESCSSPTALGLHWELWKWLPLWFLSAFQTSEAVSFTFSTLTENIWIKHKIVSSNTYKLIQLHEVRSKETLPPISVNLLEGMRGENKINGFNFILANQIPIKLKEKLKTGQCKH